MLYGTEVGDQSLVVYGDVTTGKPWRLRGWAVQEGALFAASHDEVWMLSLDTGKALRSVRCANAEVVARPVLRLRCGGSWKAWDVTSGELSETTLPERLWDVEAGGEGPLTVFHDGIPKFNVELPAWTGDYPAGRYVRAGDTEITVSRGPSLHRFDTTGAALTVLTPPADPEVPARCVVRRLEVHGDRLVGGYRDRFDQRNGCDVFVSVWRLPNLQLSQTHRIQPWQPAWERLWFDPTDTALFAVSGHAEAAAFDLFDDEEPRRWSVVDLLADPLERKTLAVVWPKPAELVLLRTQHVVSTYEESKSSERVEARLLGRRVHPGTGSRLATDWDLGVLELMDELVVNHSLSQPAIHWEGKEVAVAAYGDLPDGTPQAVVARVDLDIGRITDRKRVSTVHSPWVDLAYLSDEELRYGSVLLDRRRLVPEERWEDAMAVSRDGVRVVRQLGRDEVVLEERGTTVTALFDGEIPLGRWVFSEDGLRLVFVSADRKWVQAWSTVDPIHQQRVVELGDFTVSSWAVSRDASLLAVGTGHGGLVVFDLRPAVPPILH